MRYLNFILIYLISFSLMAGTAIERGIDITTMKVQSSTPSAPASGYKKAYFKGTGLKILDSSGNETGVGSGSNDNYLTYGDAENGTTGWATYADAAGSSPVDGTGGSSGITIAATSTTPIDGVQSYTFTHPASNTQGSGMSYDFTIPKAASAKSLTISFLYEVVSGTFTDSDVNFYIYDVDGSTLIQPTAFKLDQTTSGFTHPATGTFQTPVFTTATRNLRLIIHSASTSTSAFVLKLDNFKVAMVPRSSNVGRAQLMGTVVISGCSGAWSTSSTSFASFSTLTGCTYTTSGQAQAPSTNIPAIKFASLPAGDYRLEYEGGLGLNAASTSTTAYFQFTDGTNTAREISNYYAYNSQPISSTMSQTITYNSSQSNVTLEIKGKISGTVASAITGTTSQPGTIKVWYFPSTASVVNDLGSQRVVAAKVNGGTSNLSTSAATTINFPTVEFDTHGMYSAGTFTIPESGIYKIDCSEFSTTTNEYFFVYKNGSKVGLCVYVLGNSAVWGGHYQDRFNAGDLITIRPANGYTINYSSGNYQAKVFISKIMGPSQVGPTETIAASYWLSSNTTFSAGSQWNFDSKEYDTHGAVTTGSGAWKFTSPARGLYQIDAFYNNYTSTNSISLYVYKNGSIAKPLTGSISTAPIASGSTKIFLNAGDYIDLRSTGSFACQGGTQSSSTSVCQISITRIGL